MDLDKRKSWLTIDLLEVKKSTLALTHVARLE